MHTDWWCLFEYFSCSRDSSVTHVPSDQHPNTTRCGCKNHRFIVIALTRAYVWRQTHPFLILHRRCLPLDAVYRVQCTHSAYCFSHKPKTTNIDVTMDASYYIQNVYIVLPSWARMNLICCSIFCVSSCIQAHCNLHQIRNQSIGEQSSKIQWMVLDIDNLIFGLGCTKLNLFVWIDITMYMRILIPSWYA